MWPLQMDAADIQLEILRTFRVVHCHIIGNIGHTSWIGNLICGYPR